MIVVSRRGAGSAENGVAHRAKEKRRRILNKEQGRMKEEGREMPRRNDLNLMRSISCRLQREVCSIKTVIPLILLIQTNPRSKKKR